MIMYFTNLSLKRFQMPFTTGCLPMETNEHKQNKTKQNKTKLLFVIDENKEGFRFLEQPLFLSFLVLPPLKFSPYR